MVAKETDAWITTIGLDAGIGKHVGEAKRATGIKVPLIGIAPWGMIEGRQALWDRFADGRVLPHLEAAPTDNFAEHEKQFCYMKPTKINSTKLNHDHTHFILVDDDSIGQWGAETIPRTAFEMAIHKHDYEAREAVREGLIRNKMGWQRSQLDRKDTKWSTSQNDKSATAICVCLQGGGNTLEKVLESVRNGTPVVLVRGSGQITDLIADAIEMEARNRRNHSADGDSNSCAHDSDASGSVSSFGSSLSELSKGTSLASSGNMSDSRSSLIRRVLINDPDDEWLQADVARDYGLKQGVNYKFEFNHLVDMLLQVARSCLCQVHDIDKASLDESYNLTGSMLMCIIKKEININHKKWHELLPLVVRWNHEPILKHVLGKLKPSHAPVRNSLERSFHYAFCHNNVNLCKSLFEFGEGIFGIYDVRRMPTITGALVKAGFTMLRKITSDIEHPVKARWSGLFVKLQTREELSGRQVSPEKTRWADLYALAMEIDEVKKLRKWTKASSGSWSSVTVRGFASITLNEEKEEEPAQPAVKGEKCPTTQQAQGKVHCDPKEAVLAFHSMFKYVMGDHWWYEASTLGPDFDLFLWSLLMIRQEMAELLWARLDVPVRAALLAATFYRNWSRLPDIKPHVTKTMLSLADGFEERAIQVQKEAMRICTVAAYNTLERKSRLWKGQTGVDLALLGRCHKFLEQCCGQALDFRWSGDLHPYNQPLGLYPSVLICLLSGGLLAPTLMTYRKPPVADCFRPPAQRISILHSRALQSGGMEDLDNVLFNLQKFQASHSVEYAAREIKELSDDTLREISNVETSSHDKTSWGERYTLFFMSPVTIFVIDALIQFVMNISFMLMVFNADTMRTHATTLELILAGFQLSLTLSELVQVWIEGSVEYLTSGMNILKFASIFFFWLGFFDVVARDPVLFGWLRPAMEVVSAQLSSKLCYSLSLFCRWLLVLNIISVRRDLGPLVSVFLRMGLDMCTFGAIWIVLLLAFSCAMHGTGVNTHASNRPECQQELQGALDEDGAALVVPNLTNRMSCWSSWWFLRSYYQAFGQPFFEDLRTDEAHIVTIIMWPVMNLMLVNLLIAIMNDSYAVIKHNSRLEWMIRMFKLAKDYRSASRLNAFLMLWDVVNFFRQKRMVDVRLKQLIGTCQPGIANYIEDLRVKFRRFQCLDLPAADIAEHMRQVEEAIGQVKFCKSQFYTSRIRYM